VQKLQAALDASRADAQRERSAASAVRSELEAATAAREKLLVQARLDGAALSSREREHSQQLGAKEVQVSALERELATMAGQLVAAQAEARSLSASVESAEERAMRERGTIMANVSQLEHDKSELQNQLRASEQQKEALLEQLAQNSADREFCFDIIKELKGQLAAAYSGGS
jgi:chromosome segregation ATPase